MNAEHPISALAGHLSLVPDEIRDTVRRVDDIVASLDAMLEDPDADSDGAIEEATSRFIDESNEEVALAVAAYYKSVVEPAIVAVKHEQARLAKRKAELDARKDWCKRMLVRQFAKLGVRKVQNATHFASLRAGSEYVAQVGEVDPDLLPENLVKRTVEPRINEIKKLLKADEPVDGYELRRGEQTVVIR